MKRNILRNEESGALEGLPLYLIILVVIAGVGTVILVGWMMGAQSTELDYITVDYGTGPIPTGTTGRDITVTAYDTSGNELQGAIVTLSGCGVNLIGETNSNGVTTFRDVKPTLPPNDATGTITVSVSYTGNIQTTRTSMIPVRA